MQDVYSSFQHVPVKKKERKKEKKRKKKEKSNIIGNGSL